MIRAIYLFYILAATSLFIYSFGYLDFNLTLSQNPIFLDFVAPLQHLVYFERIQSVKTYSVILLLIFSLYTGILAYRRTGILPQFPWRPFLLVVVILTLAYPMLSYDLYNYMFHGKILWFYHMNPHVHAPLEFSGDLWLRFMRWVHTPSAYGPVFTLIESPAYLLGLGKFVPVLILMKFTITAFFVWTIHLIGEITKKLGFSKDHILAAQLLIAFNPFILLEVVVNGHNDAVMISLFLLSLLYSLQSKLGKSLIALGASIGTKFVTILTTPMYLIKDSKMRVMFVSLALLAPVILSPGRFQPWYLVWALIPAALLDYAWARIWIVLASIAGCIFYVPYIATGFWVNSLPFVASIIYLPIALSLIISRLIKLRL